MMVSFEMDSERHVEREEGLMDLRLRKVTVRFCFSWGKGV